MKKLMLYVSLYLALGLYFTGCDNTSKTLDCIDGCSIENGRDGQAGPKGSPGLDGLPGLNGHSLAFSKGDADISLCPAGGSVLTAGVDLNDDTVLQASEIQATSIVCNGVNGNDGEDGQDGVSLVPNPYSLVGLVDPCGDSPGRYDEVFIRFANGSMLASFSDSANGSNTRFSLLVPGSYQTTDGTGCYFTVSPDGSLTNEHH